MSNNFIISLNQIIDLFKDFANDHPQLESFGYGPTSSIGTSVRVDYPAMWLTHEQDSNYAFGNKAVVPEMNFTVLVFDKINEQKNLNDVNGEASNNGQEIISDTEQIGRDLMSEIVAYWSQYGIGLQEDVSAFPLFDETDDKVNGWGFRITLKLRYFNCATEIGDVKIQHPTQINYLTCDTLSGCTTIQNMQAEIDALSGGTSGSTFTCADLSGCTTIQNIENDIITISGSSSNNYYTTGATLSSNTITFDRNDIPNAYSVDLSPALANYITCDDLSGCTIVQNIQSDITNIQNDITYISGQTSGGTSSFGCDDLSGCTTIQNIETNISNVEGDITTISGDVATNTSNIATLSAATDSNDYTTGATLNGDIIEFDRTNGSNAYSVDLGPALTDYITCDTLSGCTSFQTLSGDVATNTADIAAISGLTCDSLTGCTVIQEIQDDITYISGQTSGGTSTNLYNSDGSITEDRNVTLGTGDTITFSGNGTDDIFKINGDKTIFYDGSYTTTTYSLKQFNGPLIGAYDILEIRIPELSNTTCFF
jgi:hypothetical protein